MQPSELFEFCPRCGRQRAPGASRQPFECAGCGFHYYFNASIAVATILLGPDNRVLFIRRAKDPARGKLAVPGGFVDIGETAEAALRREIMEEVNLEVGPLEFLCSRPNHYLYAGVNYPVLDFFYVTRAPVIDGVAALDGVESFVWMDPEEVDEDEIAFPSVRDAVRTYRAMRCS